MYLVLATSLLACFLIAVNNYLQRKLFISKYSGNAIIPVFSSKLLSNVAFECFLTMLHPYPQLIQKKFLIWNELIDASISYKYNEILQLTSLMRVIYFGFFLITLSRYWSASAQRVR